MECVRMTDGMTVSYSNGRGPSCFMLMCMRHREK